MNLIFFHSPFPDIKERNRIYEKMLRMTPSQYAWLCAIIEELRFNKNKKRTYKNLFILVGEDSIVTKSTIKIHEVHYFNVPVLRYSVGSQNTSNPDTYRVITPGHNYPLQNTSAFFYGYKEYGIILHKLFLLTSPYGS